MKENIPAPQLVITELETLKILADPLRNQVLEILAADPQTINQIAEKLDTPASKLYYHFNLLEKHNLVKVVDTRVIGNIIEKHYWVTAYDFKMDDSLCTFTTPEGKENLNLMVVAAIDTTRDDILRSLAARTAALAQGATPKERHMTINRELSRIPDELADEFKERLCALVEEFEAANDDSPAPEGELQTYGLTVALYPSFYYPETDEESEAEEPDNATED